MSGSAFYVLQNFCSFHTLLSQTHSTETTSPKKKFKKKRGIASISTPPPYPTSGLLFTYPSYKSLFFFFNFPDFFQL